MERATTKATNEKNLQALTAQDLNGLNKCIFDWCDGADRKDWERFEENLAPELNIDYSTLGFGHYPNMTAAEYREFASTPQFLGSKNVQSQHLIGAGYFIRTGPSEAEGRHQARAAHWVYTDETLSILKMKGHVSSSIVHYFRKIDGIWKMAGLKPGQGVGEYDFGEVMKLARGEKETA